MKQHKFSVSDAEKYGIGHAVIIEYLRENQSKKIPFYNSKGYCSLTVDTVESEFPYLSYSSVRRWLKQLERGGVVESIKPFKRTGNQTKYYHVPVNEEVSNAV